MTFFFSHNVGNDDFWLVCCGRFFRALWLAQTLWHLDGWMDRCCMFHALHLEYTGLFSVPHTSSPGAALQLLHWTSHPLSGLNPHFLADLDCLLIYWAWTVAHCSLCPYHTLDGLLENKPFEIKIDYFVGATVQWLAHTLLLDQLGLV